MKIIILIIFCLLSTKGVGQNDTLFKNQELIIYQKSAYYKGKEIYNAERNLKELTEQEKTDECKVDYEFYNNPLSLVGKYYSYESGEGGIFACGVPGNSLMIQTINLNNNKKISLVDIFSEQSVLKALKQDIWIKKNMEDRKIDFQSITSFEVLLDTINSLGYAKFSPSSFAILDYDKKNRKVSVRFVGEEYMGFNHNKHLQLGLWLEPKESYKQLFQNKIYFKIGEFKNGLKN